MRHFILAVTIALLAVVACSGSKREDAAVSCDDVGSSVKKQTDAKAPPQPDGDQKRTIALVDALAILARRCKNDNWSADAIRCVSASADPKNDCAASLTVQQMTAMDDELTAAATTPPAHVGDAESTGMPDCDAYIAEVAKYAACDKVPKQARDAVKKELDAMKPGWPNMAGAPDDVRKQTNDACKQALDGLTGGPRAPICK